MRGKLPAEITDHPLVGKDVLINTKDGRQLRGYVHAVFDNGRAAVSVGTSRLKRMSPKISQLELAGHQATHSHARYGLRRNQRRNPAIQASDLRPGDTIELEDLGRLHVINGPFRSTRGIRFEDKYGNFIMLRANERVKLLARENPTRRRRKRR